MAGFLEVLSYGETIVDFLPDHPGRKLRDVELFRKKTGGAPANAAVGLARLGHDVGLMCNVGVDEFGQFLRAELDREGVNVEGVNFTDKAKTGVAFVTLDENGDRSFLFFREPSADTTLTKADIKPDVIKRSAIILAGTNLLVKEPCREATHYAMSVAKESGRFIALDPNVRLHLWADLDDCYTQVLKLLEYADLIKVNDDELEFLGKGKSAQQVYDEICRPRGVKAMVYTRADAGATVFCDDLRASVAAPKVHVVDTTGAGDGFFAGLTSGLIRSTFETEGELTPDGIRRCLDTWNDSQWQRVLELGCHVGSRVCTQFGATTALPMESELPWDGLGF